MKCLLLILLVSQVYSKVSFDPSQIVSKIDLNLKFTDSESRPQSLGGYFNEAPQAVHLVQFVYFNCGSICSPFINETIFSLRAIQPDLLLGRDFTLNTISINPTESSSLAADKKQNYLKEYHSQFDQTASPVSPANRTNLSHLTSEQIKSWRFLVSDSLTVSRITSSLGFFFDPIGDKDYNHKAVMFFVNTKGDLIDFIKGPMLYPLEVKMKVWGIQGGVSSIIKMKYYKWFYTKNETAGKYELITVKLVVLSGITFILFILFLFRMKRIVTSKRN